MEAAAAAKPRKRSISISLLLADEAVGVAGAPLLGDVFKLCRPGNGKGGDPLLALTAAAAAAKLRLESMAFMAANAGDMPGKRLPKLAKGLRGNNWSADPGMGGGRNPFVSMSNVRPGYIKGLGKTSGVISSFSLSPGNGVVGGGDDFEEESLDNNDETENMLGFLGVGRGVEVETSSSSTLMSSSSSSSSAAIMV